jgi:hypothetical protein
MTRYNLRIALAAVGVAMLWSGTGPSAQAQYYYVAPRPDAPVAPVAAPAPYGYGYFPGYGGYWQGQAAMLDAYSNLGLSQEQARIVREQANQAKLDTKVKTIDVMAYERANKYWFSDEQADIKAKQVEAAMNSPPIQEVTSGRALNTLLYHLDRAMALGATAPMVPIDPQVIRSMNVTSGANGGNAGLLREVNSLQWPVATIGPEQQELDQMLKQGTYEAMKGQVSPAAISKMNKDADTIQQQVRTKFYKSEIDGSDYIDGNRFLEQVRSAIQALKQPNAGKMIVGQLAPQGQNVADVVQSMSTRGLSFAAALPGQEGAYVAMHKAFVNYGLAAGTPDTGFRIRVGSLPNTPAKKT